MSLVDDDEHHKSLMVETGTEAGLPAKSHVKVVNVNSTDLQEQREEAVRKEEEEEEEEELAAGGEGGDRSPPPRKDSEPREGSVSGIMQSASKRMEGEEAAGAGAGESRGGRDDDYDEEDKDDAGGVEIVKLEVEGGGTVHILGTAHVSEQCCQDVTRIIRRVRPKVRFSHHQQHLHKFSPSAPVICARAISPLWDGWSSTQCAELPSCPHSRASLPRDQVQQHPFPPARVLKPAVTTHADAQVVALELCQARIPMLKPMPPSDNSGSAILKQLRWQITASRRLDCIHLPKRHTVPKELALRLQPPNQPIIAIS